MSTWIEVCHTHGQDSQSSHYSMKNLQKDTCCPGGGLQNIKQLPDLIIFDLKFGLGMSTAAQKKEKHLMGYRKNKARQCSETERLFFCRSG